MDDLIERLRRGTNDAARGRVGSGRVTCSSVPRDVELGVAGMCRQVIGGHVCRLADPHPPGWLHECWCGELGERLGS